MTHTTDRIFALLGSILLTVASSAAGKTVLAQGVPSPPLIQPEQSPVQTSPYPSCQPPNPGEYLLLVVSKTAESQTLIRRTLPPSAPAILCHYLEDVVTRVGGFTTADTANAWARYLGETAGLTAIVVRSADPASVQAAPTQTTAPVTTQPLTARSPTLPAFNPQPLGAGYAVLVDFFSRPELAAQVQQLLETEVGLASYGQRPYLLARYTNDPVAANALLQRLSDRGFWAMVVDSRRVTLLRQSISRSRSAIRN